MLKIKNNRPPPPAATYLASLALSSSSLALPMCWDVWLTMPSMLVMLTKLSLICLIIVSSAVWLTGSLMARTCSATFSMLSGSAPSSGQQGAEEEQKRYREMLQRELKSNKSYGWMYWLNINGIDTEVSIGIGSKRTKDSFCCVANIARFISLH